MTNTPTHLKLPEFARPYDWAAIDQNVLTTGGVIVKGLVDGSGIDALNNGFDRHLAQHNGAGQAATGSKSYDQFLGHNTLRLHGLIDKVPSTVDLIGNDELVAWAERMLADASDSVLLNAGEFIQIQPGEPAQFPHRDSDSWPHIAVDVGLVVLNAIIALDDCTLDNGATYVAPNSWSWEQGRRVKPAEWHRSVMDAGDALLFRGDLLHRGGENNSDNRRRVISLSYSAGWLRPVENSFLNIPREVVAAAPAKVQALLGYAASQSETGGLIGLYENGDPGRVLR